jgi:hypothetical protein
MDGIVAPAPYGSSLSPSHQQAMQMTAAAPGGPHGGIGTGSALPPSYSQASMSPPAPTAVAYTLDGQMIQTAMPMGNTLLLVSMLFIQPYHACDVIGVMMT